MRRSAYTLVEILLALSIAVLLLAALYVAVDIQLRSAQEGRERVEQSTLARSIFGRIEADATCVIGQGDSARFRTMQSASSGGGSSGSSSGSGSGTSSSTTSSSTTGSSTSGSSSGSSTTSSTSNLSMSGKVATFTNASGVQVVILPYGVIGTSQTLHLFVSRVPRETINAQLQQQQQGDNQAVVGDLRRVSYWLADQGLAKQEVKLATSDDAGTIDGTGLPPNVDATNLILAEEVKSLKFEYFDGTDWWEEWDSTTPSADGKSPIGSPVAIRITLGLAQPNGPDRTYQHVIAIATANGTTSLQQTTPTTGGGTTSP